LWLQQSLYFIVCEQDIDLSDQGSLTEGEGSVTSLYYLV
jgi:hypothetical protein